MTVCERAADSRLDVFALRGIDRERGAMVLVRPDQFIAHVLPTIGRSTLFVSIGSVPTCRVRPVGTLGALAQASLADANRRETVSV
ncbi:hypothetical protein C1890_22505 [Pseudomonas sp. DP16D-R1]|nr:hypothetical protein C1890_22505 [Pseudomonas sp. DP16D-R1]